MTEAPVTLRERPDGDPPPPAGRNSPARLVAMSFLVPRVIRFVSRMEESFARESLPRWLESITPEPGGRNPRLSPEEIVRVIWNVLRWNRGRFNNGCFVRSFTRYHFLREAGHPVVFHLGVEEKSPGGTDATSLRSHAWLTLDGDPYLEFQPERFGTYRVLFSYPRG